MIESNPHYIPQGLTAEKASEHGRRVAIALMHGNAEEAHQIVDEALAQAGGQRSLDALSVHQKMELHTTEIGLDVRTVNMLETHCIYTVEDLVHTPRAVMMSWAGFGEGCIREVDAAVERLKLWGPQNE